MHAARLSHVRFIFNLNIKILSFTDRILRYFHIINACPTRPLLPTAPCLLTWRTSPLARSGKFPSTLVPGLLTTAPPLASPFTPSHPTHRSSYNVYRDVSTTLAVLAWHTSLSDVVFFFYLLTRGCFSPQTALLHLPLRPSQATWLAPCSRTRSATKDTSSQVLLIVLLGLFAIRFTLSFFI
jgi:hypothetical protein